ncbi:RNA 2',3'-cyclic phosphodiesterase [Lutimaribacter marinistellae]|uniref:RNA 2',3'-cyclic phosphodiesterase n=1 Tax=Lutimaribacter marinistellae TaxID=1820329 RepID=A0ABV7TII4_9RHOB
MRCFLAIPLTDPLRDALARLQAELPVGRLVPEENLHLTLAFLDERDDPALAALDEELSALSAPSFDLIPRGLGVFGGNRPRSLHAVILPSSPLADLHARIQGAIRRAGIDLRRERYVPHITLARFGTGARGASLDALQHFLAAHLGFEGPPFPVTEFHLYQSVLRPDGALHEELARYPLISPADGDTP